PATRTVGLEHRRVDDPYELPPVGVDEPAPRTDLEPSCTEQCARVGNCPGGEEDRVAGLRPDGFCELGALAVTDVLRDRSAELSVVLHEDVGESLRPARLRPVLPRVELLAALARATGHDEAADVRRVEAP